MVILGKKMNTVEERIRTVRKIKLKNYRDAACRNKKIENLQKRIRGKKKSATQNLVPRPANQHHPSTCLK